MTGVWLRYLMLWRARLNGRISRWLLTEWRIAALGLIVTAAWVLVAERLLASPIENWFSVSNTSPLGALLTKPPQDWFNGWKVLGAYSLAVILWWAWQARRRLIIDEFVDHSPDQAKSDDTKTPNDGTKSSSRGLSALLVIELLRLRDLYRDVDEQRATSTSVGTTKEVDAAIKIEDTGEFLRGTVSAESKLSIGPLGIPVGAIMALFGKLVQGPRIVGHFHIDGNRRILTAQMVGGMRPFSWRVEDTPGEDGAPHSLGGAVAELASRIFTDIALGSTVQWRATAAFSAGLRAYRDCLRTSMNRKLNLQLAERELTQAIAADSRFDLAYYNLGVVYTELGQSDSAETAFLKAIEINPSRSGPYYALAQNRNRRGLATGDKAWFASTVDLCDQVIDSKSDDVAVATAWDLKGLALHYSGDHSGAVRSCAAGVRVSWRALCNAESEHRPNGDWQSRTIPNLGRLASTCLRNFAVVSTAAPQLKKNKRIRRLSLRMLYQALSLAPSDANLRYEIGKGYSWLGRFDKAVDILKEATRIAQTNPNYWSELAWNSAQAGQSDVATNACQRVLDCVSSAMARRPGEDFSALDRVKQTYEVLKDAAQAMRVAQMQPLSESVETEVHNGTAGEAKLQAMLPGYGASDREWEYGEVASGLGRLQQYLGKFKEAEKQFSDAIKKLENHHPGEIHWKGLRAFLARALRSKHEYGAALRTAEAAVARQPLRAFERKDLVDILVELNDYSKAIAACQDALVWSPDDPELHWRLGICYWKVAFDQKDSATRRAKLAEASRYLGQALDLYGSAEEYGKRSTHYWLGKLHHDLGEFPQAFAHYRFLDAEGVLPLIGKFWLGCAYLANKDYPNAELNFRSVIDDGEKRHQDEKLREELLGEDQEKLELAAILSWAHSCLARSYVERCVRSDEAMDLLNKGKVYAGEVKIREIRERSLATCAYCEGLALAMDDKLDEAIVKMKESVSLVADAEAYLGLALAYTRSMDTLKNPVEIRRKIREARACLELVSVLDWKQTFSDRSKDVLAQLQMKESSLATFLAKAAAAGT